jgi:hypothetical protein
VGATVVARASIARSRRTTTPLTVTVTVDRITHSHDGGGLIPESIPATEGRQMFLDYKLKDLP